MTFVFIDSQKGPLEGVFSLDIILHDASQSRLQIPVDKRQPICYRCRVLIKIKKVKSEDRSDQIGFIVEAMVTSLSGITVSSAALMRSIMRCTSACGFDPSNSRKTSI